MASLTKRSRSDVSNPANPSLPEHILYHMIVPRLPFKTLNRFQCVSKKYRSLIGHDPLFPSEQARLLSPYSIDLVHLSKNGRLFFLINPESIGVPDPSLQFLGKSSEILLLLCSANGLLLFYGFFDGSNDTPCLCNPATQEKVFMPRGQFRQVHNIGLAFDPTITPNQYILVNVHLLKDPNEGNGYGFEIFRSDTGQWSKSNERIHVDVDEPFPHSLKRVHVQGVIYWHFRNLILWYNTQKDWAGFVPLPTTEGYWCMGVYAAGVVWCHTCVSGVEVWRLANGTHWDRLHCISWDSMTLQLDGTWLKMSQLYKSRLFRPLAFDGQFIYLLDFVKKGAYTDMGMGAYNEILGYNICTQHLEKKGRIFVTIFSPDEQVYDYHNIMSPLPKILG